MSSKKNQRGGLAAARAGKKVVNNTLVPRNDLTENEARILFAMHGVHELFYVREFDYSSITQRNADSLLAYTKMVNPELVIMPFWKSENSRRRILARSALIACRGVGSILMYNKNGQGSTGSKHNHRHAAFSSGVTFEIGSESSPRAHQEFHMNTKDDCMESDIIRGQNNNILFRDRRNSNNTDDRKASIMHTPSQVRGDKVGKDHSESFECHRLLLLEDDLNDWL
jgi:hypothetical protein